MKSTNRAIDLARSSLTFRLYQRLLTTGLLTLLVLNLLYIHFFIPDGLAGLTIHLLIQRWNNPMWGLAWRLFDWLLVGLGGLTAAELILENQGADGEVTGVQKWLKGLVLIAGSIVMIISAQVIFGPRS